MKINHNRNMMPESQDKSPKQGLSAKPSVVEVLKSVVIRKRAKKAEELARKLREKEEADAAAATAAVIATNGINKKSSVIYPQAEKYINITPTSILPQPPPLTPDPVPKKRPRKTPRWEDTPQLINFNLPPPPLLPPIETFNILSSLPDTSSSNWSPLYNGAKALDSDTLNFIHRIYCRECRMEEQRRKEKEAGMAEGGSSGGEGGSYSEEQGVDGEHGDGSTPSPGGGGDQPISPMTVVEEQSLQMSMETNKESLKRKLMFRRSIPELVDQGIYPPLKTPPSFAEQRTKLERAKTGDFLRHKLQARPDRASLVEHHILEDSTIDPSLQEKQRLLKRARLQDSLSERLINRPGPLELVERNILPINPELDTAVREGIILFPKTSDVDDPHRRHYTSESEDGSTFSQSEGVPSPQGSVGPGDSGSDTTNTSTPGISGSSSSSQSTPTPCTSSGSAAGGNTTSLSAPPPPDITPLLQKFQHIGSEIKTCTFSQTSVPTSQSFTISSSGGMYSGLNKSSSSSSLSSLAKAKKKKQPSTSRPLPSKSRVIKFHEYKGPPNLVKSSSAVMPNSSHFIPPMINTLTSSAPTIALPVVSPPLHNGPIGSDSPYSVMLHQQQLLLQWQLEVQQKNLPFLVPTKIVTPDQLHLNQLSPGSSASISSPGSVSSSGLSITPCTTPQPTGTPSVTPVPPLSVTPQPPTAPTPPRALTPGSTPIKSPAAPIPSPAGNSNFIQVPVLSPPQSVPPPPPLPPPPPPLPGVSTILAIPKSIPVVMAANSSTLPLMTTSTPALVTTTTNTTSNINLTFPSTATAEKHNTAPLALKIINNNSSNSSNSSNKITKLEDLKVADLKQECKKRNLPVSGPKPNLLNKLAAYADDIVKEYQEKQALLVAQNTLNNIINSKSKGSNNSDNSMKTPPNSASSIGSLGSVFAGLTNDDATMMPISPPTSPSHGLMDLNASIASVMSTPLSPPEESMDVQMSAPLAPRINGTGISSIASPPPLISSPIKSVTLSSSNTETANADIAPATSQNQPTSSVSTSLFTPPSLQSIIAVSKSIPTSTSSMAVPMAIDPNSRPPSVTPMEFEVDSNNSNLNSSVGSSSGAITVSSQASSSVLASTLPTITQGQVLQSTPSIAQIASLSSLSSIAPGTSFTLSVTQGGTPFTVSMTKLPANSQGPPSTTQKIQFAKPTLPPGVSLSGPAGKPMQIQIAPSLSQIRPATTAILRPVTTNQSGGVTQIHIPVSQIQPPIKVPIQVSSSTQAKVHLPPGPLQFPLGSNGQQQPGQIAVPVTGSLPMSAEVSIPVSGGTIQIPVSQLPSHLQQQVSIQIQQQLQQQAAIAVAKKTGGAVVINKGLTPKLNSFTGKLTNGKATIMTSKLTQFSKGLQLNSIKTENSFNKGLQTSNGRPKAMAKPRPNKGKGKNVKNVNGGKSATTSPSPGSSTMQPVSLWQQGQPQVLDIHNDPSGEVLPTVDIKQEKPCSPDAMQTSPEQRLSPTIKTEPVPSPPNLCSPSQSLLSPAPSIPLTQEELVAEQQRQIEELRNELLNSHAKLQEAQTQAQKHQEQLRKLTLAKIASLTQQNTLNALLVEQAKTQAQIQALTNAQNEQMNQITKTSILSPTALISNGSPTSKESSPTGQISLIQTSQNHMQLAETSSSQTQPVVTNISAGEKQPSGNFTSLLQAQGLQKIDLSQTKIVQVINANGQPQYVLTSQPNSKPATGVTNVTSGSMTSVTSASKAHSVPSSPAPHTKLHRSSTNPIFVSNDLKSPPNYDEAVKNKQNIILTQTADGKYTQMDDVLDVLIQSGELPPSAAQEPPPTPKTQQSSSSASSSSSSKALSTAPINVPSVLQGATITIPASSVFPSSTSSTTISGTGAATHFVVPAGDIFSTPTNGLILTSSAMTPITTPAAATSQTTSAFISSSMAPSPSSSTTSMDSSRKDIPPPLSIDTASPASNHDNNPMEFGDNLSNALSDLPLLDMEWTNTDFLSSPNLFISNEVDSKKDINLYTPPLSGVPSNTTSTVGDNKLMDMVGLSGDVLVPPEQMSVDVSDWLDAIMPSTGLTPLGCNAPTSFNGDPVLTPKPQDVLDLFNMDDTDLCTPTELNLPISGFDKVLESATSSASNS